MSKRKASATTKSKKTAATKKKEELDEMEKRLKGGDEEEPAKKQPAKKKAKKEIPAEGLLWKEDHPVKIYTAQPAEPTANDLEDLEIVCSKIKGKNLEDKNMINVDVFMAHPKMKKGEGGKWPVQPIKYTFTDDHSVTEPSQFKDGTKSGKAKIDPKKTWSHRMQINPKNKRHALIVKHAKTIHDSLARELSNPEFWKTIGHPEYAMDEETMRTTGKSPIYDDDEGISWLTLKFQHAFGKRPLYTLVDQRPGKKPGAKPTEIVPSLISDEDSMRGTIEVAGAWVNPGEQTWGWNIRWKFALLTGSADGTAGMSTEEKLKLAMKYLIDDEAEEVDDEEAEKEDDEAGEEEEEEEGEGEEEEEEEGEE